MLRIVKTAFIIISLVLAPCFAYGFWDSFSLASNNYGEKVIIVNPRSHTFHAYEADGSLARSGTATAGSSWCRDLHRPCHTRTGTFRIFSLGGPGCRSHKFPLPRGGAPMPYCMYFAHGQALHGSPEGEVVDGNISHGCVRLHVWDARWLRYNFVEGPNARNGYRGTRVVILPY